MFKAETIEQYKILKFIEKKLYYRRGLIKSNR